MKGLNYDRVFICGPSGTGKTTLARYIRDKFFLEYVSKSTSDIWPKYGINNHNDIITMSHINPSVGLDFQLEVARMRLETFGNKSGFVTDRSPLDSLVYFTTQNLQYATTEIFTHFKGILNKTFSPPTKTLLIFLPFTKETVLENNNRRIVNPAYQFYISSMFEAAIEKKELVNLNMLTIEKIPYWNMSIRKTIVSKLIGDE